ncbi:carbohydrate ABC transporter permease [Paenibacillus validus]|uniref:ABC transporter permease subunit n=1 Tax=Paenibacillus validus TaxID=44253 RepID=A0A7X2Z9S6_9BACL|nr:MULTISPECIES: carbohydrate ABC transporter permease [Paenibacillus]MED4599952.1 carbohydrate ABC transporter permease [Paenibacillus validus]MED4605876.1 carbohydrate ABC transporter permease [Paenibacillus validus]MUG70954.1 ABC transporter permease subunit [Paenibacillus validus]
MAKKSGLLFYVGITIFIAAVMFPFFWVFLASVKETEYLYGPHAFDVIVPGYTLDNYVSVFVNHPFGRYLLNSLTVAGLTMLYSLFVASFAAYAIARLQFFGKTFFLGVLLAVSMFPQIATISPIFLFMQATGLRNTYLGLIIPYTTFALPLSIWYMTTFFQKIPYELEEAAKVDGASIMQTFRKILLPLAAPGLFTTAIIVFVDAWHEFFFSLTINTKESMMTVPVGIAMFQGEFTFPWGEISAATITVTVPVAILVLLFQRQIVSGLTSGAVKE